MIKRIVIENFKCFNEPIKFDCGKINLFAGINGRGKSTALQALMLLSQSISTSPNWTHLHLKGENINLGEYVDVKNANSARSKDIHINLYFDGDLILPVRGNEDEKSPYRIKIINSAEINSALKNDNDIKNAVDMLKAIHFVSADRLGPQMFMEKVDLPEFIHVGKRGEFCFELLTQANSKQLDIIPNKELYRGEDANSLLQQTIEWMAYILDGAKIETIGGDSDSAVLSLKIGNRNDTKSFKPVNIGFGYSYALPLIVAGLIAKPGEILIAENPEAHLHPRAQSRIAEFYSLIAASGVQVFIETHSEHILNGVRLSTLKPNIQLNHDDVGIFFFDDDFSMLPLTITPKGKIERWPKGFFDQQDIDLSEIYSYASSKKHE